MCKKDGSKERREDAVNVTEMKSESPADCNGPGNQPQTEQHVHSTAQQPSKGTYFSVTE
jgi:hypothetical protein